MAKTVQEEFLNNIISNKTPVTVFLVNGVKLQGLITSSNETSLLLKRDGHTQLIFNHAISTIMPNNIVDVDSDEAEKSEK